KQLNNVGAQRRCAPTVFTQNFYLFNNPLCCSLLRGFLILNAYQPRPKPPSRSRPPRNPNHGDVPPPLSDGVVCTPVSLDCPPNPTVAVSPSLTSMVEFNCVVGL